MELYERGVAAMNARQFSDELAAEILASDFRMENTSTAVTDKTYVAVGYTSRREALEAVGLAG